MKEMKGMKEYRERFAESVCFGRGIEVGALHHPVLLPPHLKVRYVDRISNEDLRKHYPELNTDTFVALDVVDDGESLTTFPDGSENFIIACQFIEHSQNPIRTIVNMLRVVTQGGFIILTVPDKRYSFDAERPITPNEHLMEECLKGTEGTFRQHYREWATFVNKVQGEEAIEKAVNALIAEKYSIHFHVWDSDAFIKFILFMKESFKLPFELYATEQNGTELMVSLRKWVPAK